MNSARAMLDCTMREAAWQRQVVAYAEAHQWTVWHDHDARWNDAGLPDLLLIRERVVWAELKREGRQPTAVQRWFHDLLRRAGAEVYVWHPSEWEAVVATLGPVTARKDRQ